MYRTEPRFFFVRCLSSFFYCCVVRFFLFFFLSIFLFLLLFFYLSGGGGGEGTVLATVLFAYVVTVFAHLALLRVGIHCKILKNVLMHRGRGFTNFFWIAQLSAEKKNRNCLRPLSLIWFSSLRRLLLAFLAHVILLESAIFGVDIDFPPRYLPSFHSRATRTRDNGEQC